MTDFDYRYAWGPRLMGFDRKGQLCRVLVRGAMNSALIEFADGFRAVVSRNALRIAVRGQSMEWSHATPPGA